jgi:tetratricopeptide (TPR) repeat protein
MVNIMLLVRLGEWYVHEHWDDLSRFLEQHPEFLGDDVDFQLERLVQALDDSWRRLSVQQAHAFLRRCCEVGVRQAALEKDVVVPESLGTKVKEVRAAEKRSMGESELDEVIRLWYAVIESPTLRESGAPFRSYARGRLGFALLTRYLRRANGEDLRDTIGFLEDAQAETPRDSLNFPEQTHHLGICVTEQYKQTGNPALLNRAMDLEEMAVNAASRLSGPCFDQLTSLGLAFLCRFERESKIEDIDRAVRYCELALEQKPPNSADHLGGLGACLLARYSHTSEHVDLKRSVRTNHQALKALRDRSMEGAQILTNLGLGLVRCYEATTDKRYLKVAVNAHRKAIALTSAKSPARGSWMCNLGTALKMLYESQPEDDVLREAVEVLESAADRRLINALEFPQSLSNLAGALALRYRRFGLIADLERAIVLARHAVRETDPRSTGWALRLNDLALYLRSFSERRHGAVELDEAIKLWTQLVQLPPRGNAEMFRWLLNLGGGLMRRFLNRRDPADLQQAVDALEKSLTLVPADFLGRGSALTNLGMAIRSRFDAFKDPDDAARAVVRCQQAVDCSLADSPTRATCLNNLGLAYITLYRLNGVPTDREQARKALKDAIHRGLKFAPGLALTAARDWGNWAFDLEDWEEAERAYGYAYQVNELLWKKQAFRVDQESWLREFQGVPARRAYALAKRGAFREAVVVLEQGRALILAEALDRERKEFESLGELGFAFIESVAELEPLIYVAATPAGALALLVDSGRSPSVERVWLPELTEPALRKELLSYFAAHDEPLSNYGSWLEAVDHMTRWIWDVLIFPILKVTLPSAGAVFISIGLLSFLPLHGAWTELPNTGARRYAFDEIGFRYAPSARALQAAKGAARRIVADGLLVVEEPKSLFGKPIYAVAAEVQAARSHFPRHDYLANARATRAEVLSKMMNYPVLHFACHAFARLAAPLDSGLFMAEEEILTLRDVLNMKASGFRLVVLSACETGIAGLELADEVVSLPTGFFQAGAAGVIASFWR